MMESSSHNLYYINPILHMIQLIEGGVCRNYIYIYRLLLDTHKDEATTKLLMLMLDHHIEDLVYCNPRLKDNMTSNNIYVVKAILPTCTPLDIACKNGNEANLLQALKDGYAHTMIALHHGTLRLNILQQIYDQNNIPRDLIHALKLRDLRLKIHKQHRVNQHLIDRQITTKHKLPNTYGYNRALARACVDGLADAVNHLCSVATNHQQCFELAVCNGHVNIGRRLLCWSQVPSLLETDYSRLYS